MPVSLLNNTSFSGYNLHTKACSGHYVTTSLIVKSRAWSSRCDGLVFVHIGLGGLG